MARRTQKTAYNAALKEAQRTGYAITRETVGTLKKGFEDAIKDLLKNQSNNPLVAAQQADLRRELRAMIRGLEKLATSVTSDGVVTTLKDISAIHAGVVKDLVKGVGGSGAARQVMQRFNRIPIRAVAALNLKRQTADTFRTLIERNIADAAPELDILLTRGVAQGMSPARLTNDIADLLTGSDPHGLGEYGLESKDVSGIRTLYSDSRRIAVSETNNALREANTLSLKESPVLAATWQRSGRHEGLKQKHDRCDDYAEEDRFGLGQGMWLIEQWPNAPHPYCACVQGGPVVYMDVEDWMGMRDIEPDEEFEE
jgi:type IV pilus biogenesis protein CpaD/CtpE